MTPIHHPRMSHSFRGGGTPCGPKGRGVPVCYKHQGEGEPRGGRTCHPFQEGVAGRDESPKEGWGTVMSNPKKGWGDRDESPKRGVSRGGSTNHNQGEGWGGSCGPSKHSISVLISKRLV